MSRQSSQWIGATPDTAIPARVKLRVFEKFKGICPKCTRKLKPGFWECDHIVALVNGGRHAEDNFQPLCAVPCHKEKSRADVALKSKNYQVRSKHFGLRPVRANIQSAGFRKASPQRTASRPIERKGLS